MYSALQNFTKLTGRSSAMLTILVLAYYRMKIVLTNKNTKPSANSKENRQREKTTLRMV